MVEIETKVGQLDHGKTTGMDGGQVLNCGCTNGLQGYGLHADDDGERSKLCKHLA